MKVNLERLAEDRNYCETVFRHYVKTGVLRKTAPLLFQKHINKAMNNLEFANFILEEHNYSLKNKLPGKTFFDWCLTIYYYAAYRTALALAARAGYESKSHAATIAAIILFYYHKDNLLKKEDIHLIIGHISIEKEEIELMLDAKGMRENACYGVDALFEKSQAERMQKRTAEFVSRIKQLLEENA